MSAHRVEHLAESIRTKIEASPEGCWLWVGCVDVKGYGRLKFGTSKGNRAHRKVYECLVGPIEPGLHLDHLCRVRNCVNPQHLEKVTPQENTDRGNYGKNKFRKTHCLRGHEYDADNTYFDKKTGWRQCLRCKAAHARARLSKKEPNEFRVME